MRLKVRNFVAEEEALFQIKVVSKLTGLTADTIRAWERRYEAVQPVRSHSGVRMYTSAHVSRLELLRRVVSRGHAIGRVSHLTDEQLRSLLEDEVNRRPGAAEGAAIVDQLLEAIEQFDHYLVDQILTRTALILRPRDIVHEVAEPLVQAIGENWARGRFSIAQEHMATHLLRNLFGTLLRLTGTPATGRALVMATPPGEQHEVGLLMVALLAASQGIKVCYLGAELPMDEILEVVDRVPALAVALSVVTPPEDGTWADDLLALRAALPASVEVWLGGRGTADLRNDAIKGVRIWRSLPAIEAEMERMRNFA
jgi:DNA-binding transcriptional MerR regulator